MLKQKENYNFNDVNITIGQNLRYFRKGKGVTLNELAEQLGISYQQLQKYEKGKSRLRIDMLISIAEYFDTAPTSLFECLLNTKNTEIFGKKSHLKDSTIEAIALFEGIEDANIQKQLIKLLKNIT